MPPMKSRRPGARVTVTGESKSNASHTVLEIWSFPSARIRSVRTNSAVSSRSGSGDADSSSRTRAPRRSGWDVMQERSTRLLCVEQ